MPQWAETYDDGYWFCWGTCWTLLDYPRMVLFTEDGPGTWELVQAPPQGSGPQVLAAYNYEDLGDWDLSVTDDTIMLVQQRHCETCGGCENTGVLVREVEYWRGLQLKTRVLADQCQTYVGKPSSVEAGFCRGCAAGPGQQCNEGCDCDICEMPEREGLGYMCP
jgi:hypothetical protein